MAHAIRQRVSAVFLLVLFLTPLVTTEWHDIVFSKSILTPWTKDAGSAPVHLADGFGHEAHQCAICDFSFAQTLLIDGWIELPELKLFQPVLLYTYYAHIPSTIPSTASGRGPPCV